MGGATAVTARRVGGVFKSRGRDNRLIRVGGLAREGTDGCLRPRTVEPQQGGRPTCTEGRRLRARNGATVYLQPDGLPRPHRVREQDAG